MKKFKSLCLVMVFLMALTMLLPTSAYAAKSAGTVKNNVSVVMEYNNGETVAIPGAWVGIKGGLLGTKFLLGSDHYVCDKDGKVSFKQTSRVTDMYFDIPEEWAARVDIYGARAEYKAKLMGTFKYKNYEAKIKDNKFRVGMPLAWTTVDTTIYFKAKSFDVVFDKGEGEPKTVKAEYLKTVEIPEDPVKEGHTFKCWVDEEGKAFDFDTKITKDITLTAKWEANKYKVTFMSEAEAVAIKEVEYGKTVENQAAPEREGYNFSGWYNGEEKFDFDTPITAYITLTAKWEIKEYTLTFNYLDGSSDTFEGYEHGKNITAHGVFPPVKTQVKEGFIHKGWIDEKGVKFTADTIITRNMTLYPRFVLDTKIDSKTVNFFVYNNDNKGEMTWVDKDFIELKEWGYISNASKLPWITLKPFLGHKKVYVEEKNIPEISKLYDSEGDELDVKSLIDKDWINNHMKEKFKDRNCELRVYRLTKQKDGNIHVDLALFDTAVAKWVHKLDQ